MHYVYEHTLKPALYLCEEYQDKLSGVLEFKNGVGFIFLRTTVCNIKDLNAMVNSLNICALWIESQLKIFRI